MPAGFCTQCGSALPVGGRFCTTCGSPAPTPAAPTVQSSPGGPVDLRKPAAAPPPPPPPAFAPRPFAPPPAGPPPTGRRRGPALLVGVGVVVLALVSGAVTVWLLNRGDEDTSAGRGDALDVLPASIGQGVTVLGEPERVWTLDAADVLPDGRFDPLQTFDDGQDETPNLLTFGDIAVVRASGGEDSVLAGVDTRSGEVVWRVDEDLGECLGTDEHLYCRDAEWRGLSAVDPATGRITGATDHTPQYSAHPVEEGDHLFVLAGDDEDGYTALALDPVSLHEAWSTPIDGSEDWVFESGETTGAIDVGATEVTITLNDIEGPGYLTRLDRRSGTLRGVSTTSDSGGTPDGDWLVDEDWEHDVVTVSRDGEVALSAPGSPWPHDGGYVVDGRIGIGNALHDIASGSRAWSRDDLPDGYYQWASDGDQVVHTSSCDSYCTPTTSVLAADDGHTEWSTDGSVGSTWTQDAVLGIDSEADTLTVRDRHDGTEAWTRSLGLYDAAADDGGMGGTWWRPELSDHAVLAIGSDRMLGATGFPARAPGAGSDEDDSGDDDTAYVTACGRPPEFVPVASETAFGGVTITYEVRATCPGGQWLNHSQLSVPFLVDGYAYAAGWFDFSDAPYWVPDDGVELSLVYPFENTQVPEPQISRAIEDDGGSGDVVVVPCEPGPDDEPGAVPGDPSYGTDPDEPTTADGAPDEATDEDRDETALEALRRIAAEDEGAVEALGTNWTAQLSSKRPGTADDGIIYDSYDDILALHLQHRARYPDALLVFSTDWPGSFGPSSRDYWVTLAGQSEATTAPVLRWCRSEGWGEGDCWAKRLRRSGDPAANTDRGAPDERNN